ncbi:MAG TPA: hypothetical protein V6D47_20355 [Oscillatoriaceae cyanobacterium]
MDLKAIGFSGDAPAIAQRFAHDDGWRASYDEYAVWTPGSGIEVWRRRRGPQAVFTAHFHGAGAMRLGLVSLVPHPGDPLAGVATGWIEPPEDDPGEGLYAIALELPAFALARRTLAPPAVVSAQVVALAEELNCYRDTAAFEAAQSGEAIRFEPEQVLGAGHWQPGAEREFPEPLAIVSGTVRMVARVTNPATDAFFHHLLVRTRGGMLDVVAAPEVVTGEPVAGGVVVGRVRLSARIAEIPWKGLP